MQSAPALCLRHQNLEGASSLTNSDRLMGVPSVGSTSGEDSDGDQTDTENPASGVADDSLLNAGSGSGAVEGSRELEVLA